MRTAIIEFSAYSGWSIQLLSNGNVCHCHDVGFINCNGIDVAFLECKVVGNEFVFFGDVVQPTFEQAFAARDVELMPGVDVSLSAIVLPPSASVKAAPGGVRGAGGEA